MRVRGRYTVAEMSTLPLFDWEPAELPDLMPDRVPEAAPVRQWNRIAAPEGPPELWVIDATALLVRAYHGMHPRWSRSGAPVGALHGLAQLLMQVVRRNAARQVAVVYDAGRSTFRNRIDPRYKAHRGEPPEDLAAQLEPALRLGQALGFAAYSVPDYEADDLAATLARVAREAGTATRLVSVDKDLCQLVRDAGPAVRLEDPKTGELYDEASVRQRMGVLPASVVDLMALTGDTSDNIPGVRGVGRQAAVALLETFGDLEGIFADLGRIEAMTLRGAKGLARKLEAGRDEAFLARKLVRLCDEVPVAAVEAVGSGRAAVPGAAGDLLARTRWAGPGAGAEELFAELGIQGTLRGFFALHGALA